MKHIKGLKKRLRRHLLLVISITIIIFPVILDLFYLIPCKYVSIAEGPLLNYYAVAFGVFGSFITYYYKKQDEIRTRNSQLKPYIAIDLELNEKTGYYELTLTNLGNNIVRDVFVYDKELDNKLDKSIRQLLQFTNGEADSNVLDFSNFDKDLVDKDDGYPRYILISCCDAEDRMWQGEYIKLDNGNKKVYIQKEMYLV